MLSYLLLAKAAWLAFLQLKSNKHRENTINLNHEKNAYTLTCAAFPLLTAGLLLGCFWAKIAWGDYWDWDPKELWSLATWLVFVGYFHFRYKNGTKSTRANSIWIITGFIFIIITLLWVNLSRIFAGLHSYA
jgi:ABC-type transport system involved in cytochrome c biogenesis permease subunit